MKTYEYLDNAYWEKEDKSLLKCIRVAQRKEGGKRKDVLVFPKFRKDGSPDPDYREVVETLGIEKIDANTAERKIRKEKENKEQRAINEQKRKSSELEHLFNLKLQAFEIPEIKESSDRDLRTRMRRAINPVELNAIAALIIGKKLGYFIKGDNTNHDDNESRTD